MNITVSPAVDLIVALVLLVPTVVGLTWGAYLLFHHDHSRGHCGWSGCQADTPRSTT